MHLFYLPKYERGKNMNVTEIFGSNVFNDSTMKERLPKATYKALKKTIDDGLPLDATVAEVVANAMKYVVILGDGMADYPVPELGSKTPLQSAYKPNIDMSYTSLIYKSISLVV